jgi:8-oxo-dGTP pyrophosphatase MutT (NUDIX family)
MRIVHKVVAYITLDGRLLVFRHPKAPEAGIQVPAGTLEPGEAPADGALREAMEETGLESLRLAAALGEADFDVRPFGREETHHRHFFHLVCGAPAPETWQHHDPSPSGGEVEKPLFEFFWARMPHNVPELIGGFGERLPTLYALLDLKEQA